MTIQWGDTGKNQIGTLKTITLSLATPRENSSTLSPSDTSFTSSLPTTQTSSIGATYTIQQSDLPTISPSGITTQYCAVVIVSGKNTTASAITVNSQCFKNGTSLAAATNNSIAASNYWTHLGTRYNNISVGDVLNAQVWASVAGVTYDYCVLMIYPTQIIPYKQGTILKDLTFSNYASGPTLSNVPTGTVNYGIYTTPYQFYLTSSKTFNLDTSGTTILGTVIPYTGFGLMRANYSDSSINTLTQSSSTTRYSCKNVLPQTITYREVLR